MTVGKGAIALIGCVAIAVGGCGSPDDVATSPSSSIATAKSSEAPFPTDPVDVLTKALDVTFTWYPDRDPTSAAGFSRATPYFTDEFAAEQTSRTERGNTREWLDWAAAHQTVIAESVVVAGEHPPDTADKISRIAIITQRVKAKDGKVVNTITLQAVTEAVRTPKGWRVSAINLGMNTLPAPTTPNSTTQPAPTA